MMSFILEKILSHIDRTSANEAHDEVALSSEN